MNYIYRTDQLGVSEEGIHCLRGGYPWRTIHFDQIQEAVFKKGYTVVNVWVTLTLGLVFTIFPLWYYINYAKLLIEGFIWRITDFEVIWPVIPILIGCYLIYVAIKKEQILWIKTSDGRKLLFNLATLAKNEQLAELRKFLQNKLYSKVVVLN